jgi:hypothetical protein
LRTLVALTVKPLLERSVGKPSEPMAGKQIAATRPERVTPSRRRGGPRARGERRGEAAWRTSYER